MSRHENRNKKRKKWHYVYRKFGITNLILKTRKQREKSDRLEWLKSKKLHMEKHYEGSNILFLESRALGLDQENAHQ